MSDKMALSYSRLSTFENCPAQFDYLYVSKSVRMASSEAIDYGHRVHKVLEDYGRGELNPTGLTEEDELSLKKWGNIVDVIMSRSGEKKFEYQMAVNENLEPVDWFADDTYFRSIADVLVIDGDTAYCLDYKTGKVRESPTQLQLFAAMIFWHFPEVQTVKTSFIWLRFNKTTNTTYERRYLEALWGALKPRVDKVHETIELGVFDTKPSGLCPWCPAKDICPDARLRRK